MLLPFFTLLVFWHAAATYEGNFALSFDGLNDVVQMPHMYTDSLLTDAWTLEAWIKPSEHENFQPNIVGFPRRHPNLELCGLSAQCKNQNSVLTQLREKTNGKYFTIISNGAHSTVGKWMHVAASWDNVTLNLFINGEIDATSAPYTSGYKDAYECIGMDCEEGLQVGGFRFAGLSTQYFEGLIDEVRVWSVGRSQKDIQYTMKQTLQGHEPGLLYYWRFDEGKDSLVRSLARDGFGILGGGKFDAVPRWVASDSPLANEFGDGQSSTLLKISTSYTGAVVVGGFLVLISGGAGIALGFWIKQKIDTQGMTREHLQEENL